MPNNPTAVFTDTHCHIHEESYDDGEAAYQRALNTGIGRMICVGTDEKSSREAAEFAAARVGVWASIGMHPHDASNGPEAVNELGRILSEASLLDSSKIVAIGEIGLDYFYDNSPRGEQIEMLHRQIELARKHNLPIIFHVRQAFDDFWPVFDQYEGLRGVLHSYTDNMSNLEKGLSRGLYIGVNGIATFAKDSQPLYKAIPSDKMLLETDAPYLTPHPHRGKVNEPALMTHVAQHIANLQSINLEELSRVTEQSATDLFSLK